MKISIDKTMDEVVSITNQIAGLKMLLDNKKKTLARYFEKSGERTISNEDCTIYVQERTIIKYDVDKVQEKLGEKSASFIDKEYVVSDWKEFTKLCKAHGITPAMLRPFIRAHKEVNEKKLTKLYERGVVSLTDLGGCYEATVNRSVALRMKNVDREIPIPKESK